MIDRLISNTFVLVIVAVCLIALAIALIVLGGACWVAFTIWRVVFGFFM